MNQTIEYETTFWGHIFMGVLFLVTLLLVTVVLLDGWGVKEFTLDDGPSDQAKEYVQQETENLQYENRRLEAEVDYLERKITIYKRYYEKSQ